MTNWEKHHNWLYGSFTPNELRKIADVAEERIKATKDE